VQYVLVAARPHCHRGTRAERAAHRVARPPAAGTFDGRMAIAVLRHGHSKRAQDVVRDGGFGGGDTAGLEDWHHGGLGRLHYWALHTRQVEGGGAGRRGRAGRCGSSFSCSQHASELVLVVAEVTGRSSVGKRGVDGALGG
jgi:hypothetical protein